MSIQTLVAATVLQTSAVSLKKLQSQLTDASRRIATAVRIGDEAEAILSLMTTELADVAEAKQMLADAERAAAPFISAQERLDAALKEMESAERDELAAKAAIAQYEASAKEHMERCNAAQVTEDVAEKNRIASAVANQTTFKRGPGRPKQIKPIDVRDATGIKLKCGDEVIAVRSVRTSEGIQLQKGDKVRVSWTPSSDKDSRTWVNIGIASGGQTLGFIEADNVKLD